LISVFLVFQVFPGLHAVLPPLLPHPVPQNSSLPPLLPLGPPPL
jgi:hypothetical protein